MSIFVDFEYLQAMVQYVCYTIDDSENDSEATPISSASPILMNKDQHEILDAIVQKIGKLKIGGSGIPMDKIVATMRDEIKNAVKVHNSIPNQTLDDNVRDWFMKHFEDKVALEQKWWQHQLDNLKDTDLSKRVNVQHFLKYFSKRVVSQTYHQRVSDHTAIQMMDAVFNCQQFYDKFDRYERVFFPFNDKKNAVFDLYCTNPTEQVRVFELDESRSSNQMGTQPSFNQVLHLALLSELYDNGSCPNTMRVDAVEMCTGDPDKNKYLDPGDTDLSNLKEFDEDK